MSGRNEDAQAVERWIHAQDHERGATPSYWRFNEWLDWQQREFLEQVDCYGKGEANFVLMTIANGIQAFAEANMFDLPLGDSSHVHAVEVIWRVDVSSDGGDTYAMYDEWSEDKLGELAEKAAREHAGRAKLDGHEVKIYRVERVKFDRIEVKK